MGVYYDGTTVHAEERVGPARLDGFVCQYTGQHIHVLSKYSALFAHFPAPNLLVVGTKTCPLGWKPHKCAEYDSVLRMFYIIPAGFYGLAVWIRLLESSRAKATLLSGRSESSRP